MRIDSDKNGIIVKFKNESICEVKKEQWYKPVRKLSYVLKDVEFYEESCSVFITLAVLFLKQSL